MLPDALVARGLFYLPDHDLLSSAFTVIRQLEMIRQQSNGADVDQAAERTGVVGAQLEKRLT